MAETSGIQRGLSDFLLCAYFPDRYKGPCCCCSLSFSNFIFHWSRIQEKPSVSFTFLTLPNTMVYAITGIPPVQDVPPRPRRDISTWYNDRSSEKEVSLFIQALTIFQKMDPLTDPQKEISYYRIAGMILTIPEYTRILITALGIHGFPIKGWDGESNPTGNLYCVHGGVTFPNWHRPYLLLFEVCNNTKIAYNNYWSKWVKQRIYEIMMNVIIPEIPSSERATWVASAQNWRLPYWDWAASYNQASLPVLLTSEKITISKPGNTSDSVPNPLIRFSNPNGLAMGDRRMKDLRIARFPIRQNVAFPVSTLSVTLRKILLTRIIPISLSVRVVKQFQRIQVP